MLMRFEGQTIVVTGGTAGIGRAIVEGFFEAGAHVVLCGRSATRAEEVARAIDPGGERVRGIGCDVTIASEVAALVGAAARINGGVDVLVNNAGTVTIATCADMSEDEYDHVMDVNVKGVFLCSKAAIPGMLRGHGGSIVNVASQAGKRGFPKLTHYCASKAAVIGFTRSLAAELAPAIRVNAVCPGIVNTDMMEREYAWEEELTGTSRDELRRRWLESIPLGRFQEPGDVANAVLFLASPAAAEVTGEALNVTGGGVME